MRIGRPGCGDVALGGSLAADPQVSAQWLAMREPADAAARAGGLADVVRRHLAGGPVVVHDLGSGTGSMGRWLAPRLPGPQHWVLYDRDPALLAHARRALPAGATVATRRRDITGLRPADLAGAGLVTASALLDILTAAELDRVVAACAGRPVLFTLNVTGQVELTPPDPLDAAVGAAFNDHQRRVVNGRRLLGPDAVEAAVAAVERRGVGVQGRPSPWRLGPELAGLAAEWFRGWAAAAVEQRPELAGPVGEYAARRLAQLAAGRLTAVVHHTDLLAGCE